MNIQRILVALVALFLLAGLAACSDSAAKGIGVPDDLAGTSWDLQMIGEIDAEVSVDGTFDDDITWLRGDSGCNDYNVSYVTDGETIGFSTFSSTRRVCSNPAANKLTQEYGAALLAVRSYQVDGDTLEMFKADGERVLLFGRK